MKVAGKYLNFWFLYPVYAFAFFALLYAGISAMYEPRGLVLRDWRSGDSVHPVPFYRTLDSSQTILLRHRVRYGKDESLVLPRISGSRIIVRVSGEKAAVIGSHNLSGNIWSQFHWIPLPEKFAGQEVDLELEITGVITLGIREYPYILPDASSGFFRFLSEFIFRDLHWIMFGAVIVFAAILINYSFIDRRLKTPYLLTGAGILLGSLYLLEFSYRADTGTLAQLLLFRKVVLFSGYTGSWFILAGMEQYFYRSWKRSAVVGLFVLAGNINLLAAVSLAGLKKVVLYSSLTGFLNWLALLGIAFQQKSRTLVFSLGVFIVISLSALWSMLFAKTHIFLLHIGYVFAMAGIAWTIIQEFRNVHYNYHAIRKKSMLDPLTGAYNRYYLDELPDEKGSVIILADMNDFKNINDYHGHEAGDRVLTSWVEAVKENIRESDAVVRLGGDEFLILLRETREDVIVKIAERFHDRMKDFNVSFSYGVQKVETGIEDAVRLADSKMYLNKNKSGL